MCAKWIALAKVCALPCSASMWTTLPDVWMSVFPHILYARSHSLIYSHEIWHEDPLWEMKNI